MPITDKTALKYARKLEAYIDGECDRQESCGRCSFHNGKGWSCGSEISQIVKSMESINTNNKDGKLKESE